MVLVISTLTEKSLQTPRNYDTPFSSARRLNESNQTEAIKAILFQNRYTGPFSHITSVGTKNFGGQVFLFPKKKFAKDSSGAFLLIITHLEPVKLFMVMVIHRDLQMHAS